MGTGPGRSLCTQASRGLLRTALVAWDVTGWVCGGPRTMFALLGVTTLVLVAGAPWVLPSAAGERRGVPAQASGRGARLGGGDVGSHGLGRWLGGKRCPSGRPLVIPGRSAQIETDLGSNIKQEEVVFKILGTPLDWRPAYPSPDLGAPSPPVLRPRPQPRHSAPRHWMCESLRVAFVSLFLWVSWTA